MRIFSSTTWGALIVVDVFYLLLNIVIRIDNGNTNYKRVESSFSNI